MALTNAERQARLRARVKQGTPATRYRRPADRRRRPEQWADAVKTLIEIVEACETWLANMPPNLSETTTAARLNEVVELRDLVEQLAAAELPKGFGRD